MNDETKICPDCAESVKAAAKKCRYCGHAFKELGLFAKASAAAAQAATEAATVEMEKAKNRSPSDVKPDEFNCPKCGKAIKAIASKCNHCGYKITKADIEARLKAPSWLMGCIFLALFVVLFITMCSGGSDEGAVDSSAAEDAEKTQKGFHCLSEWNGSNQSTVRQVEGMMRNPDSFEHVETRITPLDEATGEHGLWMTYRAQNGFGGMNVERMYARVNTATCESKLYPNGPGSE